MPTRISRRKFLAASAASAFAAPMYARAPKPGEKLNLAVIGVNNRGGANLNGVAAAGENIVALCDVDPDWSGKTREKFPKAEFFTDYRKMFDAVAKEIDAVVISTPDFSHTLPASIAMHLGKHVYCEKPLASSLGEVRYLRNLAAEKKVVTQMGTQIHAEENYRRVVEIVRSGKLGAVNRVHVWMNAKPVGGKKLGAKPSAKFDIDLWRGPAQAEFFEAEMNKSQWTFAWPHFHWRFWWEFAGGTLADFGCHYMDLPMWALSLTAPERVTATGKKTYMGDNTVPDVMQVDYHFPKTSSHDAVHMTWYHGVPGPDLSGKEVYKGFNSGILFVGEKGNLVSGYKEYKLMPEAFAKDFTPPSKEIAPSIGHHKEWCEAIKGNGKTLCNFAYSGGLTETVLLGNLAYRVGTPVAWNAADLSTASKKGDALLHREYRKGWELPKG